MPAPRSSYIPCQMALVQALSHPDVVTRLVSPDGVHIRFAQRHWHVHARSTGRVWRGLNAPLLESVKRGHGYTITTGAHLGGTDAWELRSIALALLRSGLITLRLPYRSAFDLLAFYPFWPGRLLMVECTGVTHQRRLQAKSAKLAEIMLHHCDPEHEPYCVRVTPRWGPMNDGPVLALNETMVHIRRAGKTYNPVSWVTFVARCLADYNDFNGWVASLGVKDE